MYRMFVHDSRLDRFVLDRKKQVMREIGRRYNRISFAELKDGLRAYMMRTLVLTTQWFAGFDSATGFLRIGCKRFSPDVAMKIATFLLDKPRKKK